MDARSRNSHSTPIRKYNIRSYPGRPKRMGKRKTAILGWSDSSTSSSGSVKVLVVHSPPKGIINGTTGRARRTKLVKRGIKKARKITPVIIPGIRRIWIDSAIPTQFEAMYIENTLRKILRTACAAIQKREALYFTRIISQYWVRQVGS